MKFRLPESESEFIEILKAVPRFSSVQSLISAGLIKRFISKAEAYRQYGRANVDFWIKSDLVKMVKDGDNSSTLRLDRIQLEAVALTSNRAEWFALQYKTTNQ
jgi:hypothetical protein